ncbi:MAG TPA: allantoicase [Thermoanaerobaculia bacterium]|nr:allantoicase [Thermoanaerobaculia bacterium]
MPVSSELIDLASERLGGAAVAANDEFFASKDNLVKPEKPVWREGEYTDRGKWMDGWETRRRRDPGYDWCVVRLGVAGIVRELVIDTTHFKGNAPESCSVETCDSPAPDPGAAAVWSELLPRTPVRPDTENVFAISGRGRSTHLRLSIHPDGGVARLRARGEVLPDWDSIARRGGEVDLAAVENGGVVVSASDEFFGSRQNLVLPGRGRGMHDGWETRRRRGAGHDWAVVRLGRPGSIHRVEIDTLHFKGNAPGAASVEVCRAPEADPAELAARHDLWKPLLAESKLAPNALHRFEAELARVDLDATHARLNIFPDGGVSRLRLFGVVRRA